jgi:hypothetical protein
MKYASISFCFASLTFMLAACGSIGQPNIEGKKPVEPTTIRSQVDQLSLAEPASGNPVHYILYESVSCESEWDQYCDSRNTIKLEAPANWQVCKPIYSVVSQEGDRNVSFWATSWYSNDTQRPSRFRAYILRIWSNGSGFPRDRWGSHIQLKDVGLSIIPADADNDARRKVGCDLRYDVYKSIDE